MRYIAIITVDMKCTEETEKYIEDKINDKYKLNIHYVINNDNKDIGIKGYKTIDKEKFIDIISNSTDVLNIEKVGDNTIATMKPYGSVNHISLETVNSAKELVKEYGNQVVVIVENNSNVDISKIFN